MLMRGRRWGEGRMTEAPHALLACWARKFPCVRQPGAQELARPAVPHAWHSAGCVQVDVPHVAPTQSSRAHELLDCALPNMHVQERQPQYKGHCKAGFSDKACHAMGLGFTICGRI